MQLKPAKIHFFHLGRLTSELCIPLIIDPATPNYSQLQPHYVALTKKIFSQIGQELSGAPSHATAARSERYGAPCKEYSITTDFNSKKFARYFCSVLANGHTRTLISTGQYINLSIDPLTNQHFRRTDLKWVICQKVPVQRIFVPKLGHEF